VAVSRSGGPKLMRDTRYVGNLRGRRTTYMDANAFKSYEGQSAMNFNSKWLVMVACGEKGKGGFKGRLPTCVFTMMEDDIVTLAPIASAHEGLLTEAREAFGDLVFTRPSSSALQRHANVANSMFWLKYPAKEVLCIKVDDLRGDLTPRQRAVLPALRHTLKYTTVAGMEFQKDYDVVISALGWVYNRTIFDESIKLKMTGPPWRADDHYVYPELTGDFESTTAPDMFVAGSAAHGMDRYRYKASGGFIHGFRFNVRSLWRILEGRYQEKRSDISQPPLSLVGGSTAFEFQAAMPRKKGQKRAKAPNMTDFGVNMTNIANRSAVWAKLVNRINNAAGPYEMVAGSLADAIVYDCKNKKAWYIEDNTEDLIHDRYAQHPRLVWSYYYGSNFRYHEKSLLCELRSARTAVFGTFVHPVLQYFPPNVRPVDPKTKVWNASMGMYMSHTTHEHPGTFFEPIKGVSRVHFPDQFVWTDWTDFESLGVLEIFMQWIEHAAGNYCKGHGKGVAKKQFDEEADTALWTGPEYIDDMKKKAGKCWG